MCGYVVLCVGCLCGSCVDVYVAIVCYALTSVNVSGSGSESEWNLCEKSEKCVWMCLFLWERTVDGCEKVWEGVVCRL